MDGTKTEQGNDIIERVKKFVDIGDGYIPTTIDYLCVSILMEIATFTVALVVSPVIKALATIASFLAVKSALHSGEKKWIIITAIFFIIDFIRLATTKAFIE